MRVLHAPVHNGIVRALADIFNGGFPADKVIQRQLKINKKWGSSDRKLFAEGVYDVVRWWRKLVFVCDLPWPLLAPEPGQLAAVVGAWAAINKIELGKSVTAGAGSRPRLASWDDPSLPRAVRESVPDWLDEWAQAELGEKWGRILPVLNTPAPVYLRANRLKLDAAELVRALGQERIAAVPAGGDTVKLEQRANVFLTRAFKAGYFELQDLHSQRVAPALAPEPGERVVDACAGAGGKTLHLAALMGNKGRIVAMDVAEKKLAQLRERSTRAGATCIETRWIEGSKVIKRQENTADRLLLDVPCSGLGVMRRNPDAKWRLTRGEMERLGALQREILDGYVKMLAAGGTLVYSTCSVLPGENEAQINGFLSRHETDFSLAGQETLFPREGGGDGFYIAVLRRRS